MVGKDRESRKGCHEAGNAALWATFEAYYASQRHAIAPGRMKLLDHPPKRAMAVGAHPDDAELSAGATLARWIAAGCELTIVVCTDGAAGSADVAARTTRVSEIRRQEQRAAALELGAANVEMLPFPDGGLEDTREFRGAIVELIRKYRPQTVLTHDARTTDRFVHRDHRITGAVVEDAIYPYARDPLHYPEHLGRALAPHKVKELLLWESDAPNVFVDAQGYLEDQARALAAHASQLAGIFGDHPEILQQLRERAGNAGLKHGVKFAETFRRLPAPR